MKSALILFAHGSRDPEWAAPFRKIQNTIAGRCPEWTVELAFLEFIQPTLADTVETLVLTEHGAVTVAPLFMAQGGHLKRDLPLLIEELRRRFPAINITLLPPIGEISPVLDAISDWLVNAMPR